MFASVFRRLSISAKLNLMLVLAIVFVFGIAGTVMTASLSRQAEERSVESLQQINQRVIYMVEAYASALEHSAATVGAQFTASLSPGLSLHGEREIVSGNLSAPVLSDGEGVLNNNFTLVDKFTATTGAVATIFVRRGDNLIRVSTSLKKENGERAIGTVLDHAHPAWKLVMGGEAYTGRSLLFGRDYMTHYLPLKDSTGAVIGASFIGIDFTEGMRSLKQKVLAIHIGQTGYVFALEMGKDAGKAVIHPSQEGVNLNTVQDREGHSVVGSMLEQKSGILRYSWPDDSNQFKERIAALQVFEPWKWLIVVGVDRDEIGTEIRTIRMLFIVTGILVVIVLAGCVFLSTRTWVSRPLGKAVDITRQVAQGDLRVQIESRTQDEVGKLFQASAQMCTNLRAMIGDINVSIESISSEARILSAASGEVTRTSGEQSASAAMIASASHEVAQSIQQVSEHAQEAKGVAEQFGAISDRGVLVVGKAIESMGEIATTVREASSVVTLLGEQSEQISSIVNVIREIAAQTNLLALNAAIEAARAGEHGRGFAVVADEVRKLAERTTVATKEISDTIIAIQDRARNAVEQMSGSLSQVEEGVELANEAGSRIAEIRQNTVRVSEAIVSISHALEEQSSVNRQVSGSVEKIAEQAEVNYQQAENTSATAGKLRSMAETLRESVSRFHC